MPTIAGPGRRPGRTAYGVCPTCQQTRHLLKTGGMGRHAHLLPGGGMWRRECAGQGQPPVKVVGPPEDLSYLYRKANG